MSENMESTIRKAKTKNEQDLKPISRVVLTPVFQTKTQEEMFARCARASMSSNVQLRNGI